MNAPCKNCERRHLHCHASCESYKAFAAERAKAREKALVENRADDVIFRKLRRLARRG